MSIERHEISGHLSKVVEHNGTVYVAGTTAEDKNPPTRACVAVELGTPTTLVEIVVTAAK